jgi:DNA-binding transcriptional LysR family regulator
VDFRHLRAFVAVAEERNFTRAAHRLHISQPPLTRQIRHLENEIGVTLFTRHRTGVQMTCDGVALLDAARSVTDAVENFESCVRSIRNKSTPSLNVGIGWGLWKAVNLIREHHAERFPNVSIAAQDVCSEQRASSEQRIDVAVTRPPVDARFVSEPLFEEHFVALLAESHPLASHPSVKLSELASESLLLFDRSVGPAVYDKTLALWKTANVRPRVVEQQPPPYAQGAMMLVASRQGYYLGIASQFTQSHRASGVAVVPLDEPDARMNVFIVWQRNDSSQHVHDFVRSAREVFPVKRHAARSRARSA